MNKFLISASGVTMAMAMITTASAASLSVPNTFAPTTTISSSAMNANFTAVQTAVNALDTSSGACTANAGDDAGGMVRVGPVCVDKNPASLWSSTGAGATAITAMPGSCTVEGTGCTGVVALSKATPGSALKDASAFTYAQAAVACANAGKRLLTPSEWMMARGNASIVGMTTDGSAEFVDAVGAAAAAGVMQAFYIGQNLGGAGPAGQVDLLSSLDYNAVVGGGTWLGFRCAR